MIQPPTWALVVSDAIRYFHLRPWQPRLALDTSSEPLVQRVERLRAQWQASRAANFKRAAQFNTHIFEVAYANSRVDPFPADAALEALLKLGFELAVQNDNVFDFPQIDLTRSLTAREAQHVTETLLEIQTRLDHDARIHDIYTDGVCRLLTHLLDKLPPSAVSDQPAPFTVPLHALMNPVELVGELVGAFLTDLAPKTPDPIAALAFQNTRNQLWQNLLSVSRMTPEQLETAPHRIVGPKNCDLAAADMVTAFLGDTPLAEFAELPLPFVIPMERRFEHCHILGGTGHGKTQLLQTLMLADFDDPARPAVVAIDSQGDMVRTLSHLARFDPALDDRLIILDPADMAWPLKLNMFDIDRARIDALSQGAREQILAGIIELYDYIFGSLLGAELTQKQSVVFRYIARLMLEIPDATIQTLLQLMDEKQFAGFSPYIGKLRGTTRTFFENEFPDRSFAPTRQQIRRRLYGVLSNPAFERMFSHPKNAFDMKAALDTGKVVLINTAKDVLKAEASTIFGRYMIALAMQAVLERAADPATSRRPAFLYIDEAADYFDQNIDTLLIQARKYRVGITLAHQHLDQLTPALRASVMTNPAVRFAGGVSERDAHALDADMRTSSDMLLGLHKRATTTEFACYVRNFTPAAISLTVPLGSAEREPRMTEDAYAALRERIRRQVASPLSEVDALIAAALPGAPMAHHAPTSFADEY